MNKFADQRAETLNPENFDCNRCERIEKDKAKGCPKCELQTMFSDYRSEIIKETLYFHGAWPRGWTLDALLNMHGEVAGLLESSKRRIKRSWPAKLARLCRIYLSERAQIRAISNFESVKKSKPTEPVRDAGTMVILKRVNR